MAVRISEFYEVAKTVSIDNPRVMVIYHAVGSENEAEVQAAFEAGVPTSFDGLALQDYTLMHKGNGVWEIATGYSKVEKKQPGDSTFQFEIGGGEVTRYQSIKTKNRYARPGAGQAPDFEGAINVTRDGVEGVSVVVPTYTFSETHYFAAAAVTAEFKRNIYLVSASPINRFPFRGHLEHEVLFLGASGSQRGLAGDVEINFRFAAQPTVAELEVGPIVGIDKEGWDYLWVWYDERKDNNANVTIKRPIYAYVEQVYDDSDFALLGIGT